VKSLLVTGGTGSLGRALLRAALDAGWERVVCLSTDEFKQAMMQLDPQFHDARMRLFLGNVRDYSRLLDAFHGVDAVIHTAALKWVGSGVYNTHEIKATNVDGTMNVIRAAAACGVRKVLVITSDKGCHPANFYGKSKAMAEELAISSNTYTYPRGLAVGCARFGNLLWSRGSVAHRFKAHFTSEAGGYRITDRRMTRFGIPLPDAAQFVLHSLNTLRGGEIFVPKLPSFRVEDVAHAAFQRHFRRNETTPLSITGKRLGGEKLHEILITPEESLHTLWQKDAGCYIVEPEIRTWDRLSWEGDPVQEGWTYSSDANDMWLTVAELVDSFRYLDRAPRSE